jgi:hypothetical protein
MEYEYFPVDFPHSGKFLETIPVGTASTALYIDDKGHLGSLFVLPTIYPPLFPARYLLLLTNADGVEALT